MSLNLLKPQHGLPKKPSEIRDNLQHILGAALPDCILPEDDNTFGFKITAQTGLTVRVGAGRGIIGKKYHDDRNYHDITLPDRKACLLYKLKNTATDSVTPSDGYVEAKFPAVVAQALRYILNGSATIENTGTSGSNIATKTGTVTPADGRVGYSGLGSATGYYTCASNTGVPAFTSDATRVLVIDNFVSNGAIQIFHNDGISKFGCTAANNLTVNGVDTGFTLENGGAYKIALPSTASTTSASVYVNGVNVSTGTYIVNTAAVAPTFYSGVAGASKSPSQLAYFEYYAAKLNPAQIAQISNDLLLPCTYQTPQSPVPLMTANSSSGCVALASGEMNASFKAYMAFRKASVPGDAGWAVTATSGYLQITLPSAFSPKYVDIQNIATPTNAPKDFTIYGSNDGGITKTILLTVTGATWTTNERKRFQIIGSSAYTTLGINITANGGATNTHINDLDFGTDVVSTSDIRSILPANSISLGYAKTNSTSIIEIDSNSYKYGIRKGATGGNRRVALGWKYFKGATTLKWDNPFGTRQLRKTYAWALDTNGTNECDVESYDNWLNRQ